MNAISLFLLSCAIFSSLSATQSSHSRHETRNPDYHKYEEELEWPILEHVEDALWKSISRSDWTILSSKAARKSDRLVPCTSCAYPKFENDCQIPNLNRMYTELFGYIENGTFVEIGASGKLPDLCLPKSLQLISRSTSDGRRWSNTFPLANIGWTGHYVEPVPQYAHVCAANHAGNPKVKTHILAVGASSGQATVYVGAALSTCSRQM
jgi:hypothetical protein